MEEYQSIISIVSLTMGAAWASGINLYAALLMLGIGGATGNIELPPGLGGLENPVVIMAAGVMYISEFVVDKIPGADTTWDAVHTFIRLPAGAMLAMGAVGDASPALEIAAAMMGGGMSATSHGVKAGTRLAINTSPEPFSNWGMSIAEDAAVFAGLWAALTNPLFFLIFLGIFILVAIWLLPKIWRGVKFIFRKLGQLLGIVEKSDASHAASLPSVTSATTVGSPGSSPTSADLSREITRLRKLMSEGAITSEEFEILKARVINADP